MKRRRERRVKGLYDWQWKMSAIWMSNCRRRLSLSLSLSLSLFHTYTHIHIHSHTWVKKVRDNHASDISITLLHEQQNLVNGFNAKNTQSQTDLISNHNQWNCQCKLVHNWLNVALATAEMEINDLGCFISFRNF
jgi:hypothetical protein